MQAKHSGRFESMPDFRTEKESDHGEWKEGMAQAWAPWLSNMPLIVQGGRVGVSKRLAGRTS
jgi:hypothetical protein